MRADRLLSLLLLLQTRGQLTAAALADELEVSERTIYRDMEALSMAGVPVYAERGPGGGCRLLADWHTDLTGLTGKELDALSALAIPRPLIQLGVGGALRQAILKLLAASGVRDASAQPRVYIDPEPWAESAQPATPLLNVVYGATLQGRQLRVARDGPRGEPVWLQVDPHGLVSKEGRWYLLCSARAAGHALVFRVDHLLAAEPTPTPAQTPADFDLRARWEQSWRALVADRQHYPVRLRASLALADELRRQFPGQVGEIDAALALATSGWFVVTLPFARLEEARGRILAWGGAAEALAPEPLRYSLADFARQAAALYAG